MIFYQICLAAILLGSVSYCESVNGKTIGILCWLILSVVPLIYKYNRKRGKVNLYKINQQRIYQEKYYNEFGELP